MAAFKMGITLGADAISVDCFSDDSPSGISSPKSGVPLRSGRAVTPSDTRLGESSGVSRAISCSAPKFSPPKGLGGGGESWLRSGLGQGELRLKSGVSGLAWWEDLFIFISSCNTLLCDWELRVRWMTARLQSVSGFFL